MNEYLLSDAEIYKRCEWRSIPTMQDVARIQHRHTLEQLEKEGMLRCDFAIQRGKNRCYRKTCRRCAALREVGA